MAKSKKNSDKLCCIVVWIIVLLLLAVLIGLIALKCGIMFKFLLG